MNALSTATPSACEALPAGWVDRIFARLAAMYGARFADQWAGVGVDELKATWAEALGGYAVEEIKRGLAACMRRDWPPTLPEFAKLCRPPVEAEAAYYEAQVQMPLRASGRDRWSHRGVYWAAREFGATELRLPWRSDKGPSARARWTAVLEAVLAMAEIPAVPAAQPSVGALPAPAMTTISREEAARRMASLTAALGGDAALTAKRAPAFRENEAYRRHLRHAAEHGQGAARKMARAILRGWGERV